MSAKEDKYVVFKKEDFDSLMEESPEANWDEFILEDAVVIRRQDIFAAPALDSYANSILAAVETIRGFGITHEGNGEGHSRIDQLQEIADYFHLQASLSWQTNRKLPD